MPGAPDNAPEDGAVPHGIGGRFEDMGELGRGGMSIVHRVLDRYLEREVARKTLNEANAASAAQARQFLEEARVTGQLDHPNIVPVYDLAPEQTGRRPSFTMKLISGDTLAEVLTRMGEARLQEHNLEQLLQVLLKVCDAMSFAHSHGFIHRDLKPQNVMIGSHGQVYVTDWGLAARRVDGRMVVRNPTKIAGTPGYMPPEQAWLRVDALDGRSDIYALGGILYRILTAMVPHEGTTAVEAVMFARNGTIAAPQRRAPDSELPPELCRIAMKALARAPAERYQSVEDLAADIERSLRGGGWFATRTAPAGSVILEQGAAADAAYILVLGRCEAYKIVDGKRTSLRIMQPGEVFGETALLTAQPRTCYVSAVDDVLLKVVTRQSLERELSRNNWLHALVHALAARFKDVDERATELQRLVDGGDEG